MSAEFTATFAGTSPAGHYILTDVSGPGLQRDHVWVNCARTQLPMIDRGVKIAFQADYWPYKRRRTGKPGMTLTNLRQVRVIE